MDLKHLIIGALMSGCAGHSQIEELFKRDVLHNEQLVVVDFYTDWCGICRVATPSFERLSHRYNNARFAEYNCDNNQGKVCNYYGIHGVPTFIVFNDGKEVGRYNGFTSESDLRQFLDSTLR